MQISNTQHQPSFQKLKVLKGGSKFVNRATARFYRNELIQTKNFDLIVDSTGFSLRQRKKPIDYKLRYFGTGDETNNSIVIGLENLSNEIIRILHIPFKNFDEVISQWQKWLKYNYKGNDNIQFYAELTKALDNSYDT